MLQDSVQPDTSAPEGIGRLSSPEKRNEPVRREGEKARRRVLMKS